MRTNYSLDNLFTNINRANNYYCNRFGNINSIKKDCNEKKYCETHNQEYSKYCHTCSLDICFLCENFHVKHELINYKDILPNEEERKTIINTIKKYKEDYNSLLEEILKWKNEIDRLILDFQEQITKDEKINSNIDFILSCDLYKMNYESIIEFRRIYLSLINPIKSKRNNQIINYLKSISNNEVNAFNNNDMGLFTHNNYLMSKQTLNKLLLYKKEELIEKSMDIIRLMSEVIVEDGECKLSRRRSSIKSNFNNRKFLYKKQEIGAASCKNFSIPKNNLSLNTFLNISGIIENNNNKKPEKRQILEKYIDLKSYSKRKKNSQPVSPKKLKTIFSQDTINNIRPSQLEYINRKNLFGQQNLIHKNNIAFTPIHKKVYVHNNNQLDSSFHQNKFYNGVNPSILNQNKINMNINITNNNNGNNTFQRNSLQKMGCKTTTYMDNNGFSNTPQGPLINDSNEFEIHNKYIPLVKSQKRIFLNKDSQSKTYIHKKFDSTSKSPNLNIGLNATQLSSKISEEEDKVNDSSLNNTICQSFPINYNLEKKIKIKNSYQHLTSIKLRDIEHNTNTPKTEEFRIDDVNGLSLKKKEKKEEQKISNPFQVYPNNYTTHTYNPKNKQDMNVKIVKTSFNHQFIIDKNKPLCIGLELGNDNCKIGIVNQENEDIELVCFKEKSYSIPTLIYFDEKNEIIKIGYEAKQMQLDNPSQTIFNILKIIGKKQNEIKGNLDLWPFFLFFNENIGRPYVKLNYNGQDEKIFFFEDLLTIYLKKLFELLFSKLVSQNDENLPEERDINRGKGIIKIVLVITIPNYFNYLQRKVIEKIFQTQIFPEYNDTINILDYKTENISLASSRMSTNSSIKSNIQIQNKKKKKLYSGYQILLKDIKIENSSSVGTICLKESNENKISNTLLLNIEGGSTNLSLTTLNTMKDNNLYEIKSLNSLEYGEEDFIDYFLSNILKKLEKKDYEECLNSPSILAKLRRNCEIFINNQDKISDNEEFITKINNKKEIKIINNQYNFEKTCLDIFNKIINLIKNVLKKSKMKENNIDNIVLLGNTTNSITMKKKIRDLFKYNSSIFNKLSDNQSEPYIDFYIVVGAALQSLNIILPSPKYKLTDISPISFGIETLDGIMDFVIEKGSQIPIKRKKYIKIKKDCSVNKTCGINQYLEIKIYEGESQYVKKNTIISCANIDKRNFKVEKMGSNYIEILVEFEIDNYYNLGVYVLDPKTSKRRFECLINIDIVKG